MFGSLFVELYEQDGEKELHPGQVDNAYISFG